MKKQMYFAETRCDKLSENTVAFQISSVKPQIAPSNGSNELWERLSLPKGRKPKRLMPLAHSYMDDYPCRLGHVDRVCASLHTFDHYYAIDDLEKKLSRISMVPKAPEAARIVMVTIIDGRIVFNLWEEMGFSTVKVLPDTETDCDYFDFALQTSLHSRDGVRIAYKLDNGKRHHYIVEQYRQGEIWAARDIFYRPLSVGQDDKPHFKGYMNTLTVR